jgi:hypothetical protein
MISALCQSTFTECLSQNHLLRKLGFFLQGMKKLGVFLVLHTPIFRNDKNFFLRTVFFLKTDFWQLQFRR